MYFFSKESEISTVYLAFPHTEKFNRLNILCCLALWVNVCAPLVCAGYWGEGISFSGGYFSSTAVQFPAEATFTFRKNFEGTWAEAGCSINDFAFAAAGSVLVTPFEYRNFQFRIRNLLHWSKYLRYGGYETDYQCIGIFSIHGGDICNPFEFCAGGGIDYKNTIIKSDFSGISDIRLKELFAVVYLDFRKRFLDNHQLYMRLSSFDEYYYPGFFCPLYSVGYSYDVSDKLTLGAVGAVRYTDQFTLNGVIDGFQARVFAAYRW